MHMTELKARVAREGYAVDAHQVADALLRRVARRRFAAAPLSRRDARGRGGPGRSPSRSA